MNVLESPEKTKMNPESYEFRTSLWASEFGTILPGKSLKILRCYQSAASLLILLQKSTDHAAVFEIIATLRFGGKTYIALTNVAEECMQGSTTCSVCVLEVLGPQSCRLPNVEEVDILPGSVDLARLLAEADMLQTKIDLLQINVLIASSIAQPSFSFEELEKQGFYLNPYGHSKSLPLCSYRVVLKWRNNKLVYVVLAPSQSLAHLPAVELELRNAVYVGGNKYCIFTQSAVERAEENRPFNVILRQISPEELTAITTIEAASIGGNIVAACHNGESPSEEVIESCLGKIGASIPSRNEIERLLEAAEPS